MNIQLTWPEQLFAAQAGVMRRLSAMAKRRRELYGTPKTDPWSIDIEACGAEAAVAKALGKYWVAVGDPREIEGDVSGIEVRSTQRGEGRLIIHEYDHDDRPYVLVCGTFPTYRIVGWLYGREAKVDDYLNPGDGREAYFVPQAKLRPIEELKS